MNIQIITGFYGSRKNPTNIFIEQLDVGTWYVVEGSTIVNFTLEYIFDGVNVELLQDFDCFTWSIPISCKKDFEQALKDQHNEH